MDDYGHGVNSLKLLGCVKVSWPNLVGIAATPVVRLIMQDRPDVNVEVHPPGSNVNVVPGGDPNRVCVFVNDLGLVAMTPFVG